MPRQHFLPDGGFVTVPDNMSWEEADARAKQKFPEAYGIQQQHGFIPAIKAGAKEGVGAAIRGLGSLTGAQGMEQYGQQMMAPDQTPGAYHEYTPDEVSAQYQKGLLPGLTASFQKNVSEPVGGMIGRYALPTAAGAVGAALAPEAGLFGLGAAGTAALARGAGFVASDSPSEMGENLQRQQDVPQAEPASTGSNVMTSLAQAALMPVLGELGGAGMKYFKLLGPDLAETTKAVMTGQMTQADAVAALNTTAKNMLVRSGEAAAVGAPMMVGTEALRRAQAGQDVTGEDAQKAYEENLKAAIGFAPIGGLMGAMARRPQVKAIENAGAEFNRAADMDAAIKDAQVQKEAAFQATPEGETQPMDFGTPDDLGVHPELQREQAILQYMQGQKAPKTDITAQRNVIKQMQAEGPTPAPEAGATPVADRAFFNAAGIGNAGAGKKIRETYKDTPLDDPAKLEALQAALTEHANSKQAPAGDNMQRLTSTIEDLNTTILRSKFDAAHKLYTETGNDAPLREILAQAPKMPLFPEEAAARAQPAEAPISSAVEPPAPEVKVVVPEQKEPAVTSEVVSERAQPAEASVAEAPVAPEEVTASKVKGQKAAMTEEAFANKVGGEWENERDASPSYPSYAELHPDAKDLLHARIEQRAVDLEGNRNPNKIEVTGEDMRAARAKHKDAVRSQEIQAELGARDPDEFMYKKNADVSEASTKAEVEQAASDMAGPGWNKDKLQVHETLSDVPADQRAHFQDETTAVSFRGDKAIVVADRVQKGQEKAVILHEVGEHVGLDAMVGHENVVKLARQVDNWKRGPAGVERESALAAEKRIPEDTPQKLRDKELIAYTAEELHARGITPRTNSLGGRFLARIRDLATDVLRRMGLGERLTGQDLIDLLHGSVAKELRGPTREKVAPRGVMESRKAAPKQAEAIPANEPTPVGGERAPLGGSPEARKAAVLDGVASAAHDMADKYLGSRGHSVITDTSHVLKKLVGSMESLDAIVNRIAPHMPSAKKWRAGLSAKEATRGAIERQYETVAQLAGKLDTESRLRVGDFAARSTLAGKWGHQPEGLGRTVPIDPAFAAEFNKLRPEEQHLVDAMFKVNEDIGNMQQRVLEARGAKGIFAQRSLTEGPYVHLERKGGFIATLKSQALLDAERSKNKKLLEVLKKDPTQFVVRAFDTPGQAHEFVRANKHKFAFADASTKAMQTEDRSTMSPQVLDRLLASVGVDKSTPEPARKAMEDSIRSMYLATLDRNSAQQAARARLGVSGYDTDVVSSMLNHGRAKSAYIANVMHGAEINNAFHQMKNEVEHPTTGHRVGQDDFNLIAAHHMESLKYDPTPIQDGIVAMTSAWQLATSLSYHLANFSQTIMVSLPKLAADFGDYSGAWGHVMDGYKQMREVTTDRGMSIDLTKVKSAGLRDALEHAANLQLLDVGMTEDLKHFDKFSTGYKPIDATSGVAAKAIHKLRQVSSAVERWNRVSSATAAYNMAIAKGKNAAAAKDYMVNILRDTQGDFTHTGAPLILKRLPKIVGQYKKFQLMMAAYYVKAFVGAFRGATASERAIGRRMLGFKLLHTGIASGVLGLPLMNVASMVYNAVGGGPDDLEAAGQKLIGDKNLAQMLLHGFPSFAGLDMSAKLGDENIFSIAPYTKVDLTSKTGVATTLAGVAGPAVGQAGRMASGLGLIQQGDMYKGAEKLMPKGLEMAMQSFRLANEGYTMKNGDLVVKPEDISAFGIMLTAAGLPSTEVKHLQEQESKQYTVTKYFTDKSRELERNYVQAFRNKDQAAMMDLRAKWMDLQKSKDTQRGQFKQLPDILRHQPLSTMLEAPQRETQRALKHQREFNAS